ncbi:MAG: 6-carboxytetrahydropterin synthase [Planctomycetes bacterium]|nr:6-carboxytetrahydropterin synthase [Planctomycetota bacterium]MBI3834459.1 6-carboxytetrahydropterin synthase [Planctomycetota bacterium]
MRLIREFRFFHDAPRGEKAINSWAGTTMNPPTSAFWVIRAILEGEIDRQSGYLCDIKIIDDLVRANVQPVITRSNGPPLSLRNVCEELQGALANADCPVPRNGSLIALELHLSPYTRVRVGRRNFMVKLTQSFEFAASHRLNCANLSESENRRLFGKCNYPHGHGHNYILEVTIEGEPNERSGGVLDLPSFDRVVRERVIDPFDHRNLNVECAEFADTNPTVENIASVIWQRLTGAFTNCRLASVRVWETAKTCAEYGGE